MKSTCSAVLRRTLGVAGFLIGFGLLSAGVASADDDSPGLLGGVTSLVSPVVDVLAPVTEPVLTPLAPAVDSVTESLSPVLEPLQPVTAPLLAPVVSTVQDVPVVPRIAEPLVAKKTAPAEVMPVPQAPVVAAETPAAAPETPAAQPDRVAAWVAETPQWHQIAGPQIAEHPITAPDAAPAPEAPRQPLPEVPFALPGTTGSVLSGGSASPVVADLPARQGIPAHDEVLVVGSNDWIHGSWCYYYGRSHPS
ncbi:hypothetical protein ACSHWB_21620 [Lentzea sp. HUAS TT2]|uniref:hypothetical protein n=1 Tax=Lentzea sp. HUAS TT2 TaxID=3447454 RepID=UPI003F6EA0B1